MQIIAWEGSCRRTKEVFTLENVTLEQGAVVLHGARIPDNDRASACEIRLTRQECYELLATALLVQ